MIDESRVERVLGKAPPSAEVSELLGIGAPTELRKVRRDGVVVPERYVGKPVHGAMVEREAEYLADYAPSPPGATRFDIPEEDNAPKLVGVPGEDIGKGLAGAITYVDWDPEEPADAAASSGAQLEDSWFHASLVSNPKPELVEDVAPEVGVPELRTPIAWTLGQHEWCYGPEEPGERDWEPIYYFDEIPEREARFSGAWLGWGLMAGLFVGSLIGRFVWAAFA